MCPGVHFDYCTNWNDLLDVEWHGGESEMTKEEYARSLLRSHQLRHRAGGHVFVPRTVGTGYVHPTVG